MKLLIFCYVFLFNYITLASPPSTGGELMIYVINNSQGKNVVISMYTTAIKWDYNFDLTTEFGGGSLSTNTSGLLEFYHCWEHQDEPYPSFGYGIYTVEARINGVLKDNFVIDYRTTDFPTATNGDLAVDFNVSQEKFKKRNTSTDFPFLTAIWIELPLINYITEGFEPQVPSDFQFDQGSNPVVTWWNQYNYSEYGDYVTHYDLYRSVVGGGLDPGTFYKIAEIDFDYPLYTDYDLLRSGSLTAYYKVVAVNGDRESQFSPMLSTDAGFYKSSGNSKSHLDYKLSQNYPNPFNPQTTINYSLPNKEFVIIKVYDISGKEVAILTNDWQEAGKHSLTFNSTFLSSGVYIYRIEAGKFISTRKFTLLK